MSIDSGGIAAEQLQEKKLNEEKKPVEENELEDGELTDDDDEPVPPPKPAAKESSKPPQIGGHSAASKSSSQLVSSKAAASNAKPNDLKKLSQSSSFASNSDRKRRRRNSEDSDDSLDGLDGKRTKRPSYNNSNNRKSSRSKRGNASTDESDDEDPKLNEKMMFNMLKQMKEFLMSSDKSNSKPGSQLEYDKFFERMKNNKSGHKEMMKFFKKNEKMINSSQDMPALNSTFNPNTFSNGPNMFTGMQPAMAAQQYPQQMNPMPGNFNGPPPYGQPPIGPFNPSGILPPPDTVLQQQYAAAATLNQLDQLAARNQAPPSLNSTSSSSQNKKQKKRKKQKEEKDGFNSDDQQVPKQLCKYFIGGQGCQKGNECDFIHSQPYNYKREICKFYLQDSCGKGNVSFGWFAYLPIAKTVLTDLTSSSPSPGDNCTFLHKEFPCKLYHTGQECTLGENCKFNHEPFNEELREIFLGALDNAQLNEELNQAYLSKNVQKKSILGPVPEDVKTSHQTWAWQQEMKKLEVAYSLSGGTKRNLFCIPEEFVIPEEPPRERAYDDEENYYFNTNFNNKDDIDERQASAFFIDTHGDLDDEENSQDSDRLFNSTKDVDYRTSEELVATPNVEPELKSLDEVKKLSKWLDAESEEDDEMDAKNEGSKKEEEQPKKSTIDISKMLDAIRQTTTSSTQNSQASNSSDNNSEFWKALLSNIDERSPLVSQNSSSFVPLKAQPSVLPPAVNQPRDPRLLRQRNKQQQSATSVFRIPADETFVWSHGDISFRLYRIDVDRIDYSSYRHVYELDAKLKNDPRLQSFFSNSTQAAKLNSSSGLPNIINPTDVLAPLTLSDSRKKIAESPVHKLIIPPAPSEKLSAFDLISPSSKQSTSQLSFTEQILNSMHLPKSKPLMPDPSGGLSSLADLVTEKSKKVNSADASNVAGV